MPRDVTALAGHEADAVQVPVSMVLLDIPGAQKRIHDIDAALYLNPTTNAVGLYPGAGLLKFVPYAGLDVPSVEMTDEMPLGEIQFTLANICTPGTGSDGEWFGIVAANTYRNSPASIWQGNIVISPGTSPFQASFAGVVKVWDGNVEYIGVKRAEATIILGPPLDPYGMQFPRRRYSRQDFPWMRRTGDTFYFGYNEVQL